MSNQREARPYQINSVKINEQQLLTIQQKVVIAKIDRIKKTLQETILNLAELKDKRFIKMKNVPVWFDRDVAGLYPRLEKVELPYAYSSYRYLDHFENNIKGMELDKNNSFIKLVISDLDFYIPSVAEGIK